MQTDSKESSWITYHVLRLLNPLSGEWSAPEGTRLLPVLVSPLGAFDGHSILDQTDPKRSSAIVPQFATDLLRLEFDSNMEEGIPSIDHRQVVQTDDMS